jgi:hypothetical protein
MANDDLANALYKLRRRAERTHLYDAVIASGANSSDDSVQVVIPSFDSGRQRWNVDFWAPRDGDYPRRGNPAVVSLTNSNQVVLVQWMPTGGGMSSGARAGGGGPASRKRSGDIASGTPKEIIDDIVLAIGIDNNLTVSGNPLTPENVAAANASHGPTASGRQSDHQGPASRAWAVDMSNGGAPTPEMDAAADQVAEAFEMPWAPAGGIFNKNYRGYRYQLIYRTSDHQDHLHFGCKRI